MATATTAATALAMTTTAAQIRTAMETLDLDHVAAHFTAGADDAMDDSDNDSDDVDDDVEPLVVCDGVSVRAFNEYVGDGEGLRIGVRFLQLEADDRLLIVDFPTKIQEHFRRALYRGIGNIDHINGSGSVTVDPPGFPSKEADATFGPFARTPNRIPKPANVTTWITLAVEVGRSQRWRSLREAAVVWHSYPGIQYVLLLKISPLGVSLGYELYHVVRPLQPVQRLPRPVARGNIRHRTVGGQTAETIELDAHRIFAIPQHLPLPPNVNDLIVVDLRGVMSTVVDAVDPQ